MTETVTKTPLEELLKSDAQARALAVIELYTAYNNISEIAKSGGYITADDFKKAENRFNQLMGPIEKRGNDILNDKTRSENEIAFIESIYRREYYNVIEDWRKNSPETANNFKNVKFWDEAFQRQYLTFSFKNLSLPENSKTPQQLITSLLKNNDGIAVGDVHSHMAASLSFISDNIETFKKAGVDTIYIEIDEHRDLDQLSVAGLKAKLNARTPEEIKISSQRLAKEYGVKEVNDIEGNITRLFLTAKENGIRIVNIDKEGAIRNFEGRYHEPSRVSSTNFIWSENIISDRKNAAPGSKYIVWGGVGHFTNSIRDNGLVDERLGIPVIAFDDRDKNTHIPILRGNSPNGADFYLPGGNCYPDLPMDAKIVDYSRAKNEALRNNKLEEAEKLQEIAAKYKEQIREKYRECYPVEDIKMHKPTPSYTPKSDTIALKQGAQKPLS